MTAYTAEVNTGSSYWPVTVYSTSDEVDAYLKSQSTYALQVQPGNPGMFVAPRLADSLVALLDAQSAGTVPEDKQAVHAEAISQLAHLIQLATLHSGAQWNWSQPTPEF